MTVSLDVVVCTYQREDILVECVEKLLSQHTDDTQITYRVIIVNNAPEAFSHETLLLEKYNRIDIIHEKKPGLSIARNKGIAFANGDWIAFLDDDALVPDDYIQKISSIIHEESWQCFGGHITSWWKYGRPAWLAEDFGSKPFISDHRISLSQKYNWGSNIIIKRSCLEEIGLFPTDIGMKGKTLGYAAENIVQDKLRALEYTIGYDPDLTIEHLVLPQKLKLRWHISSAYATGRDGKQVYQDQYGLGGFLKSFKNCISRPIKALGYWVANPSTHPKTILLKVVQPYALLAGKLVSLTR